MTSPRIDLRPGVSEPVILMFSRREVEAGDPSASVERLNSLFNTRDAIWRYRGQVALTVDGYNDDPRELTNLRPELRRDAEEAKQLLAGMHASIVPARNVSPEEAAKLQRYQLQRYLKPLYPTKASSSTYQINSLCTHRT